jgi:GSCFA family protein
VPVAIYSQADARSAVQSSRSARWSSGWEVEPAPETAWARLRAPFFRPDVTAGLEIRREDELFAIGSCFARGVESALKHQGFPVASLTSDFDAYPIRARGSNPMGFTNKYNPWAIANELEWAFESGGPPADAFVQLDDERWVDPHATPIFEHAGRDETLVRHRQLTELFQRARRCRVVTMTLGLIEAWYDRKLGLYTNAAPPSQRDDPDRFELHVLDFADVMAALQRIHALLAAHCRPDHRVVVTVSPVPLEATFTGQDVVVANTHSKALLRAAAAEWCAQHENLHYFPSFEIVWNSDRSLGWRQDGRHVSHELVRHIMDVFVDSFVTGDGDRRPLMGPAAEPALRR